MKSDLVSTTNNRLNIFPEISPVQPSRVLSSIDLSENLVNSLELDNIECNIEENQSPFRPNIYQSDYAIADQYLFENEYELDDGYNPENESYKESSDMETIEEEYTSFSFNRTPNSHKYCFVCRKSDGPLTQVANEELVKVLLIKNIYIDPNNRCCPEHLDEDYSLKRLAINGLSSSIKKVKFNYDLFKKLVDGFRDLNLKSSIFANFENFRTITADLCLKVTGFTKDEFFVICETVKSLKKSPTRSKEQAIAIYLFWLKTGLDQNSIALYFGLKNRFIVQKCCHQTRTALTKDFVPIHLGSNSLSREDWVSQNTPLIKELFNLDDKQLALIADGKNKNFKID